MGTFELFLDAGSLLFRMFMLSLPWLVAIAFFVGVIVLGIKAKG